MQPLVLYEHWDPLTSRMTEVTVDEETGLPLIRHTQDYKPIVASAKRLASNFDKHIHPKQPFTHIARIPTLEYLKLVKVGINRDARAMLAYLDMREARQFRVDDGRRLI